MTITGNRDTDLCVLRYLEEEEILRLEQVSTYFNTLVKQSNLWKERYIQRMKTKDLPPEIHKGWGYKEWVLSRKRKEVHVFPMERDQWWGHLEDFPYLQEYDFVYVPSSEKKLKSLHCIYMDKYMDKDWLYASKIRRYAFDSISNTIYLYKYANPVFRGMKLDHLFAFLSTLDSIKSFQETRCVISGHYFGETMWDITNKKYEDLNNFWQESRITNFSVVIKNGKIVTNSTLQTFRLQIDATKENFYLKNPIYSN